MVRFLNLAVALRTRVPRRVAALLVVAVSVAALLIVLRLADGSAFIAAARQAASQPFAVAIALGAFGCAFLLRAIAWKRVLPDVSLGQVLAGIHLTLGANHLLPLRLGEAARVASVTRRAHVDADVAIASTLTLRAVDTFAVLGLGFVAAPTVLMSLVGAFGWVLLGTGAAVLAVGLAVWWLRTLGSNREGIRPPDLIALGLSVVAWPLEAVLVHSAAHWAGLEISAAEALGVTAVSVVAQVAAIAPGGFGTYEAAAVAAYVAFGYDASTALVAALWAHALKTAYSLVVGGIAVFVPSPGLSALRRHLNVWPSRHETEISGDMRAPDDIGALLGDPIATPISAHGERPLIVLFMPAYNEEASVGDCVRRAPSSVAGCDVEVLVIDDGSRDATAELAAAAGAEVISLPHNRGLGAAVRLGLAAAVDRGAAVTVFCDADGEYAPEQLGIMVAPILAGEADYVVGSRFLGHIEAMKPHRRFGNIVLTLALSLVARRRISDGQTGYRAFSRREDDASSQAASGNPPSGSFPGENPYRRVRSHGAVRGVLHRQR